ncbi:hypothetical protein AAA63_004408 [Salmonella enterica subsp. enterica]|nr:hypothetical protein [Salmonella enterica subsp. enterica serovar Poona]
MRKTINVQDILDYLTDHPRSTISAVAEHMGVGAESMSNKLRAMFYANQVRSEKVNGVLVYSVKPDLPFGMNERTMLLNALLSKSKANNSGGARL